MIENKLTTPVLFLIFNKVDTTQLVFNEIRKAKPTKLFVAADGPRDTREGEKDKCDAVRKIINDGIDWDCEVHKLYREKNLGCKIALSSAIDWFFENVERGIILEDDCLPHQSFFLFCQELLEYYKHDTRIMEICGSNFLRGWRSNDYSYYFSKYGPIWGWASWRRAWKYYDVNMKLWSEVKAKKIFHNFCDSRREILFRLNIYDKVSSGEIDTWDYQWGFAKMINSGLSITPNVNLISNIGFREDGTHITSSNNPFVNLAIESVLFPLRHPKFICRDKEADAKYMALVLGKITMKSLFGKVLRMVYLKK